MPENFYTELREKEDLEDERQKEKAELIMNSYKRPRRQKAPEPLHPADERKLAA